MDFMSRSMMIWTVFEMDKEPDSVSDRHRKCSIAAGTILTAYIPLVLSINFLMFTLLCVSYWLLCFKKIRAGVLHCCTLFLCYDRNPNINNRDHLVGQLTSTGWAEMLTAFGKDFLQSVNFDFFSDFVEREKRGKF